ncbi:vertnin [Aplochiton taeniatus]
MIPRNEAVLSVLGELQDATESSGLSSLTRVALEVNKALAPFPLPLAPCQRFPDWAGVDGVAHSLYPADAPRGLLPLICNGEGDRLFDTASVLLVGTTSLSLELQVRTVVEMLLWKRYYLCGMIDSKVMLQAARFSLCAEESEAMLNLPIAVLEAIFDADVKASCFPGSYANMWHVYALASVLQCNVYSIYPQFNLKIRPYFHRLIRPRVCRQEAGPPTLHIMWSGELEAGSAFKPHRFVALVPAVSLHAGSPEGGEQAPPTKTLELLNKDSRLSYSSLKDKYNITKSTFYRWRRQTQEHRKKSAARYEAKHFLQACYLEGKLIPLHQFKLFFPEISRSTYYAWKHELMSSGGSFSTSSTGEVSPGESTEQESWSSPEGKHQEPDHNESVAAMFGLNCDKLEGERAQNVALMQEAKRCLQNCIAVNTSFPFRIFKRNFPGISRSTYYNWRREAMLFNRGYKAATGSSEDSSDADKSPKSGAMVPQTISGNAYLMAPRMKICRRGKYKCFRLVYMDRKKQRAAAKMHVQKSKWSLLKFKLRYPSLSPCYYWLWRGAIHKNRKGRITQKVEAGVTENPAVEIKVENVENRIMDRNVEPDVFTFERGPVGLKAPVVAPFDAPLPRYALPHKAPTEEQMFVMDVVALANFKAKAKLFLQQRFEEKSFPTFKEFRSYFPLTPRSTYYMWKRALHHGVPLIHG